MITKNNRNFKSWLSKFRDSIADYDYYINFEKVHTKIEAIKIELNILNSLVGAKNIEEKFVHILESYPETLKCIPLLLAVRKLEIPAMDDQGAFIYSFREYNQSIEQYKIFMRKMKLFDLLENRIVSNLVDYVTGVETGLDSHGRKNRGGKLMENLVEKHLQKIGLVKGVSYFEEFYFSDIEKKWGLDLSQMSNERKTDKRLDFVVKTDKTVYGIETNFYADGGSKLNETARSYKNLAIEAQSVQDFEFVWITDGKKGWKSAKRNLEETFDSMNNLFNINDLEQGVLLEVFK